MTPEQRSARNQRRRDQREDAERTAWKNFVENVDELARAPRIVAHSAASPANVGDNLEKVPLAPKPVDKLPPLKTRTDRSL